MKPMWLRDIFCNRMIFPCADLTETCSIGMWKRDFLIGFTEFWITLQIKLPRNNIYSYQHIVA